MPDRGGRGAAAKAAHVGSQGVAQAVRTRGQVEECSGHATERRPAVQADIRFLLHYANSLLRQLLT